MIQHIIVICMLLILHLSPLATHDDITEADIIDAFLKARSIMIEEHENKNYENYYFDARFDNRMSPFIAYLQKYRKDLEYEKIQEVLEMTTKILKHKFNLTSWDVMRLREIDLRSILPDVMEKCMSTFDDIVCDESYPYRTIDGTCNNLLHPTWGRSFTCLNRLLNPAYSDGISALRKSVYGDELPDPRTVSLIIDPEKNVFNEKFTIMFMQFGQLIAHDMTFTPNAATRPIGFPIQCCPVTTNNPAECWPINISNSDPFYSKFGKTCQNNARSHMCTTCKLGYRNQMNQRTSFLDGSVMYGVTKKMNDELRNFDGTGTLKYEHHKEAGELLPQSAIPENDRCSSQNKFKNCFEGGDFNLNQHVMLAILQTLFPRHHNRIARSLHSLRQDWSDEKIFQEARRIVVAQMQMITYNEFLPGLIGKTEMAKYHLLLNEDPIYTEYNPSINPAITAEFTTSAFRIHHTYVTKTVPEAFLHKVYHTSLKDTYRFPFNLYKHGYVDAVLRGTTREPSEASDRFLVTEITNNLLKYHSNKTGDDLAALDAFRELDHGVPPYVDVVKFCLGLEIATFDDLTQLIGKENIQAYKDAYKNVRDIDLLSAIYAEKYTLGGDIGPTAACIIGIQFYRLKYGDRFYFEHGNQVGSFNLAQLQDLKKTRLSRIICDNTKIDKLQEYAMSLPSHKNPIKWCEDLPKVDLTLFA